MSADAILRTIKAALALKGEARAAALRRLKNLERDHAVDCGECDTCIDERAPEWREESGS